MVFEELIKTLEESLQLLDSEYQSKRKRLVDSISALKGGGSSPTIYSGVVAVAPQVSSPYPKANYEGYGAVSKCIRDALARVTVTPFDSTHLLDEIEKLSPDIADKVRKTVSQTMWQLANNDKVIKQIEPGKGRRPAQYVKI